MISRLVAALLLAGTVAAAAPQYAGLIARYPAPALAGVHSRELKFLIDPGKVKDTPAAAFSQLWARIQAAGAGAGFAVTEKPNMPLKVTSGYQEYFETPGQELWQKGYLIRVSRQLGATGKKHKAPGALAELTFKSILPDYKETLAMPLLLAGAKGKAKLEDNVALGPGGGLSSYLEKVVSIDLPPADLGGLTLGEFARYLPELAGLGIPAGTRLQGTRAYTVEVEPGHVQLEGAAPCKVHLAGWSTQPGEKPYLYTFSIKYECQDFYHDAQTHASGERFLVQVVQGGLADLAFADGEKWCGSAVRKLMNRPMPR
ncbi:MAG: hypothetical protein P4L36_05305 [Holophaga sp.]|nr:hypothetical protein [Holophaga sp.]